MPTSSIFRPGWTKRANAALDALLYGLSVYGVPAVIAVMSLIALSTFDRQYGGGDGNPVDFRVFEQTGDAPEPALAQAQLADQPIVRQLDTKLSESPFWFSFTVQPTKDRERADIELPSRHAFAASCWGAGAGNPWAAQTAKYRPVR